MAELRDEIKKKKSSNFDDIPADALVLWQTSVQENKQSLETEVERLTNNVEALRASVRLDTLFSASVKYEELLIRIIVRRPDRGVLSNLPFHFDSG